MNMHGMQFSGFVENVPVLVGPHPRPRHRSRFRCVLLVVNIEAVLIFRKGHNEIQKDLLLAQQCEPMFLKMHAGWGATDSHWYF